jgi:hypothetical protein
MVINALILLLGLLLFHKFIYPFIVGFIKGYKDARNGNPYDDKQD